ncbi:hypothetical protein OH76DRAFT_1487014 [Lentinus brumalis]|uniref:Uncharacterized protein n=1 Tax=Lentinus brumalis TaxID=2498619 RepID=A0A371CWB3_9APHY|nr:hypothetical protein OH76DRAFT_1487014 [Polyporus brumalis]
MLLDFHSLLLLDDMLSLTIRDERPPPANDVIMREPSPVDLDLAVGLAAAADAWYEDNVVAGGWLTYSEIEYVSMLSVTAPANYDAQLARRLRQLLGSGTITRLATTLSEMPSDVAWGAAAFSRLLCTARGVPARFSVVGTVLSLNTDHYNPPSVTVSVELDLFRQRDIDAVRHLHLHANPPSIVNTSTLVATRTFNTYNPVSAVMSVDALY